MGSVKLTFMNVCPLDCPDTCQMVVGVDDGVAVSLEGAKDHAFTRGFLCQKMARYLDQVNRDQRLLTPLRRVGAKGSGQFVRIGWDEAIGETPPTGGCGSPPADTQR